MYKILKNFILKSITLYQHTLSFDTGIPNKLFGTKACRFNPSCSHYTYEAIESYGIIQGLFMGAKRILRCNPWNKGGFDPVPLNKEL